VFDGSPLDQQRIFKLMGAIVPLVCRCMHAVQKLVVAFTGLMDARDDRIHNTERRAASYPSARSALSGTHGPVGVGGGFERPDDARPNRDDTP
jgi:hypothetical protein